jgi:hypothetical protein
MSMRADERETEGVCVCVTRLHVCVYACARAHVCEKVWRQGRRPADAASLLPAPTHNCTRGSKPPHPATRSNTRHGPPAGAAGKTQASTYEDDAWRVLLGCCKEVAHTPRADAHKNFLKLRACGVGAGAGGGGRLAARDSQDRTWSGEWGREA